MTALTKSITAILLLLSTAGLHADAQSCAGPAATVTLLNDVIVGHYGAIAENRLKEAVRFYHNQSPEVVQTRKNIELGLSQFLLKTTTLSFEFIGQRHDLAFGRASHRFLRIAGVKFFEEFVDVSYVFRKEGGAWKLWMARIMGREAQTSRAKHRADAWWVLRLATEEKWNTNWRAPPLACYTHF